jgi:hypothetical protein
MTSHPLTGGFTWLIIHRPGWLHDFSSINRTVTFFFIHQ